MEKRIHYIKPAVGSLEVEQLIDAPTSQKELK